MAAAFRRFALVFLLLGIAAGQLFAQDAQPPQGGSPGLGFGMNLGIGVQSFNEAGASITYQSLGLTPDVAFGQFGIGLAVTINYRFTGAGNSFEIRAADWVPTDFQNILEIYLPKIRYIRWGEKGDPLFIKFGSIDDATLGNGFIVGNYANTLFLPGDRHFGMNIDLDGNLFKFPYVGIETIVGNLAVLDVLGARLYVRPLIGTQIPIVSNIELGATVAADTQPYLYKAASAAASAVTAFGVDVRLPVFFVKDVFSLVTFADVASIPAQADGRAWGGMLGVGGKLINFITYGAQLRVLGANFIPVYFDATYDLFKAAKYDLVQAGGFSPLTMGWYASLGTSFLDDKIVLRLGMDGPFATTATDPTLLYPHLRGIFTIADGIIPGLSFDFSYDKKAISTFASLVSAADAAIQAKLNYKTGPAIISFVYKLVYDQTHTPDPWVVTSGLESSIQLF